MVNSLVRLMSRGDGRSSRSFRDRGCSGNGDGGSFFPTRWLQGIDGLRSEMLRELQGSKSGEGIAPKTAGYRGRPRRASPATLKTMPRLRGSRRLENGWRELGRCSGDGWEDCKAWQVLIWPRAPDRSRARQRRFGRRGVDPAMELASWHL